MAVLEKSELTRLIGFKSNPCISIYLPTVRYSAEVQQNPVRLKNLLDDVQTHLISSGYRAANARSLLSPAWALVDDNDFWRDRSDGLVIFIADGFFQTDRFPVAFKTEFFVNNRFVIKPLIPLLEMDSQFFVLAVSKNQVRLLRGSPFEVQKLDPRDVPKNMAEALALETYEENGQFHTDTQTPGSGKGEISTVFFGYGGSKEVAKDKLLEFFQQIDRGIMRAELHDQKIPLVFAGVKYTFPIYRQANTYSELFDTPIEGNPDELDDKELRDRAWKLIEPLHKQAHKKALARFGDLSRTNLASNNPREIVAAAAFGRIDTLFLHSQRHVWGAFEPSTGNVKLHTDAKPGDEDLSDGAAAWTIANEGIVHVLDGGEMPDGAAMAAIFRYPMNAAG